MEGLSSRIRNAVRLPLDVLRVHGRSILPVGGVVLAGIIVLGVLAGVYAQLIGVAAYSTIVASVNSIESLTLAVGLVMLPLVLLGLLATLAWAGVAVQAANAAVNRRKTSMLRASVRGLARAPRALAVIATIVGAAVGAIVLAPLLLVVGVAGLLLTPRAQRSRFADRWPSRGALLAMAIPFGVAVLVLVRWSLALPSVWLDGLGVRASLRESSTRVRGRGPLVAMALLASLLLSYAVTEGIAAAVGLLQGGQYFDFAARVVALVLVGTLPFSTMTALYRRGAVERPPVLPAPATVRMRVAAGLILALVFPMIVTVAPAPADAAAGVATVTLTADKAGTSVGEDFILIATVAADPAPTGTVTFEAVPSVGTAITLNTLAVDSSGIVVLSTEPLPTIPAGEYELFARYSGDANLAPASSAALVHPIAEATTSIGVASSAGPIGDTATLTVTVAAILPAEATPSGSVSLSAGATVLDTESLTAGGASFNVDVAAVGTRALTIGYSGDAYFAENDIAFNVPKLATRTIVFGDTARDFVYGDEQTYEGSVSSTTGTVPTGTVELWWGGVLVGDDALEAGAFSITTDKPRVDAGDIFVVYPGDASHAGSDNSALGDRIHLTVSKANSVPVLTVVPTAPTIGQTVTVTATLDDLGDGPTGSVDFYSLGVFQGNRPVVGGSASIQLPIGAPITYLTADYSGDRNFDARSSDLLQVNSDRAPVAISIDDPGVLEYGEVFTLTAPVSVGGGTVVPDHGVEFRTAGGPLFPATVPVVAGTASVQVCAGVAAVCPPGVPALGDSELDITASYDESTLNLAGESAPFHYAVGKAVTTTSLVVTPTAVPMGSAIFLTATVSTSSPSAVPSGYVSFYGSTPVPGVGTPALAFLGNVALVGGIATLETASGDGADDVRWPADGITAIYFADGAPFERSEITVPITIQRIGVTVETFPTTALVNRATELEVRLSHDPGASADFTGQVTVTSDTGDTCSVWVPAGERNVSCFLTWNTAGAHGYSASYSGDLVYATGTSASASVTVNYATPNLRPEVPFNVVSGTDVTVTWSLFDPTATGTVTVWGDGVEWCSEPIAALSCVGQFGASSATGSTVPVVVRYWGDANFAGAQYDLVARVQGCVALDVRSNAVTLGTVTIDTPSNCGAGKYLVGTTVSATAHPTPGSEFVNWKKPGGSGLVVTSTSPTTSFLLTNDSSSWVHVATFQVTCATVSAAVTGHGTIAVYPASNCTTVGGQPGWARGTLIAIYPDPLLNPTFGDRDVFYDFVTLPTGATAGNDSSGRPRLTMTVQADVVVPIRFGPRCRVVTVVLDPTSPGDHSGVVTAPNCHSPQADGFLPGTSVQVTAEPSLASRVLSGWAVDGVTAPALGREAQPAIVVQYDDIEVTATFVDCYRVDLLLDAAVDDRGREIGYVRSDPLPNCPDGGGRFLAGTEVTLTPEVLVKGAGFNGWGDERSVILTPPDGIGDVTSAIRKFLVEADVELAAGFYLESSCSRLIQLGDQSLITFEATGCGAGYYFDLQKQWAQKLDVEQSSLWEGKYRSSLIGQVDPDEPLNVYVSIRGDTRGCFGTVPTTTGPSDTGLDWQTFGPLPRRDAVDCRIGGPATVWAQACQTIDTTPTFHVAGDASGASHDSSSMPGTFYLMNAYGIIEPFTMSGFGWGQPIPVHVAKDGTITGEDTAPGPCRDAGNAFPAGTDVILVGSGPSTGFVFNGWWGPQGGSSSNPLRLHTTATERSQQYTADYTVTCHTVTFGEGLSIVGDAPRCPGSSEADDSFIAGTAIQVRALQHIGDRVLEKFTSGVVADQIYEDPENKELTAFAFVDGDKQVTGYYPTNGQLFTNGVIKGLKFTAGFFAVAAPIFVGMLFPPAGILFALLGAGAGIASFIPGGDKAAAVFDLINPTKITTCIARWSFNNAGDPTGGKNIGGMISTANTIRKVVNGIDVIAEPVGPLGAAGGIASFGYGLYDAGIGDTNFGPETVEELEDRSGLTNCLDDQWRAAD